MELAIDTSTDTASLALSLEGQVKAELSWCPGRNHTTELTPNLLHLLELAKAEIQDIKCIIVAKGPGSFTGVRVGMATAKGLAFALGLPLVGISTLEVLAFAHASMTLPICPILNAGRGEIATALFRNRGGKWQRLFAEHITTIEALCAEIKSKTLFCGEIDSEVARGIKEKLGDKAVIVQGAALLRRAGFLAELGWRRLETGDTDDLATLQPLYLRKPAITMKAKP